jgi:oxygen-dependent protoporphyrinogen oxidase
MRVVVVGAGPAGLFTASELMAAGIEDVMVVDAATEPGGIARTITRDGFSLEPAAGTLMLPHPHLTPILRRVGAETVPAVSADRYVYVKDRLVPIPASQRAVLAPLATVSAKLRALAEPLVRTGPDQNDESLDDFCRRRFGGGVGELLAWLAASGVFAGDPKRLSARSGFPMLTGLESEAGSVLLGMWRRRRARPGVPWPASHLPVGGMTGLAQTAGRALGHRFRREFEVHSVHRDGSGWVVEGPESMPADAVVLAVRPDLASSMLDGELGATLGKSVSAPVVVIGIGGSGPRPLPPGYGALIGPDAGLVSLGMLFESSYAPERAPEGSWLAKVIAGGACRPEVVDWDDDRLVERVGGELARVLGHDIDASFVEVIRHRSGIPQYDVGHGGWLAEIDRELGHLPGLQLTGWGYRGVGVGHLATDAVATSRRIVGGGGG